VHLGECIRGRLDFSSRSCQYVVVALEQRQDIEADVLIDTRKEFPILRRIWEIRQDTSNVLQLPICFEVPANAGESFGTAWIRVKWTLVFQFVLHGGVKVDWELDVPIVVIQTPPKLPAPKQATMLFTPIY